MKVVMITNSHLQNLRLETAQVLILATALWANAFTISLAFKQVIQKSKRRCSMAFNIAGTRTGEKGERKTTNDT